MSLLCTASCSGPPPQVIIPSNGSFARAAAFGWASHATWKECGEATCGNRLYAPRASVPRLAAIHGKDAQVTVVAWVQLSTGQNVIRGRSIFVCIF